MATKITMEYKYIILDTNYMAILECLEDLVKTRSRLLLGV